VDVGQTQGIELAPCASKDTFTMNLRLYWPKAEALSGAWLQHWSRKLNKRQDTLLP